MDVKKPSSKKDAKYIKLVDMIKVSGIIDPDFTGKLTLSFTCGNANYMEKSETFK